METVDESRQPIAFGQPSGPEDDGVVAVWGNTGTVIEKCTGSLIAPNLVLTARHCIANYVDDAFSCTPSGDLTPGSKGGQMGAPLDPSAVSVRIGATLGTKAAALGAQIFAAQATTICRNDIAVVLLDRPLTGLPITPIRLLTGDTPGEVLRMVGYGATESGGMVARRTRSGLVVSMVGSSNFRPNGDAIPARTFVTEGPAACPGDSGGPAFSDRNAVVGLFSQVTGACTASTARDFFTEVSPFNDELFMPAFAAAQAEPVLEAAVSDEAGAAGVPDAGGVADAGNIADASKVADAGVSSAGSSSDASSGGSADSGATEYHRPSESGGCKCRMASVAGSTKDAEPFFAGFLMFAWYARRMRCRR